MVQLRLIPMLLFLYLIAYLDKTNIGMWKAYGANMRNRALTYPHR